MSHRLFIVVVLGIASLASLAASGGEKDAADCAHVNTCAPHDVHVTQISD